MDRLSLGKIIAFLGSVPPNSCLRLMLQLALAAYIPEDKRADLLSSLNEKDLVKSLIDENLLINLMKADNQLDEAEQNLLLEAMEKIGLMVPGNLEGAEILLERLSQNLVHELEELKNLGTIKGEKMLWK